MRSLFLLYKRNQENYLKALSTGKRETECVGKKEIERENIENYNKRYFIIIINMIFYGGNFDDASSSHKACIITYKAILIEM